MDKELMSLQALIHVRERNIAEKDRRIADIEKQILNEIEDAKAAKRREQADNASPRYLLLFFMCCKWVLLESTLHYANTGVGLCLLPLLSWPYFATCILPTFI